MTLYLSSNDRQRLQDWAKVAGNQECCGLLLGDGQRADAVVLAKNVADDPTQHFEIDPTALIGAHKAARSGGPALLGYFHSHPSGLASPSATDVAQAAPDALFWLIIAAHGITAWQPMVTDGRVAGFRPVTLVVEG
jgi:proteasome lid subunit RPN8/RPN11